MSIRSRIAAWLRGSAARPAPALASRHDRRAAARERAKEQGGPAWPADERHVADPSRADIPDVTPGTPGGPIGS